MTESFPLEPLAAHCKRSLTSQAAFVLQLEKSNVVEDS